MKICVYGAASSLIDDLFIKAGEELGKKMYVILVGLDENCDAVGYAIVEEVIG